MLFRRRKARSDDGPQPMYMPRDFSVLGNAFGIDLGTNNIKIYNHSSGKIRVQKNMIAVQNRTNMIAYGDSAYEMFEKSPASIEISRPISYGVIADIGHMQAVIRQILKAEQRGSLRPADYFISVPTDVTEVERRAFNDLIRDAGVRARRIWGVEKAIADGLGLGVDVKNSQGALIVDVGYDTTEVSILSLGGIVLSRLIKTGGHAFDTAIVNAVRREYNLMIGMKTAESIRVSMNDEVYLGTKVIYGRDVVTGLPMERTLTEDFVEDALAENFRVIAEDVRVILERTPPELSADIYKDGLFLTGGAGQERGLISRLEEEVGLDINMAEEPISTVALGLSQVIRRPQFRSLAYSIEDME